MWFIFPQLAGLGHSAMAQRFAIASREEAGAYLGHAVLGSRLKECTAQLGARKLFWPSDLDAALLAARLAGGFATPLTPERLDLAVENALAEAASPNWRMCGTSRA
jgi:Protein of unknown function (DUF1810)